MLARAILTIWLAAAASAAPAADTNVLILRGEDSVARQAAEFVASELVGQGISGQSIRQFDSNDPESAAAAMRGFRAAENPVVVAVGPKALRPALRVAAGRPIVATMISLSTLEEAGIPGDRLHAIVLDQPMPRLLNLIQAALPEARKVGVLAGPASLMTLRMLVRQAQDRRLMVAADIMTATDDVVPALERLVPRMDMLLAVPDPLVHNRNTVQPLLLTTYRAGIPVVAYSESYLHAGAAVALFSTPAQIARQTAETVRQIAERQPIPAIQTPRYFSVGVNASVARSLGLSLPSVSELQERLGGLE